MKVVILILVTIFYFSSASAQIQITGKTCNANNTPVEAATVSLLATTNNSPIATSITDEKGFFSFSVDAQPSYILKVEYLQETFFCDTINATQDIDLCTIIIDIDHNNLLDEVAIVGKKQLVEMDGNKLIFTPKFVSSGNAIDVIKTASMLTTDNDLISIVGKGAAGVMVNNKILRMDASQVSSYLKSIPAKDIAKIEIVKNAGAEQDAQNKNGYINIILKKQLQNGIHASADIALKHAKHATYNVGTAIQLTKNKFQLYTNINASKSNPIRKGYNNIYYDNYTSLQSQNQKSKNMDVNTTVGLDYEIDSNTLVGVSGIFTLGHYVANDVLTTTSLNYKNLVDSSSITNSNQPLNKTTTSFNIYSEKKLDNKGKKVRIDGDYFLLNNKIQQDFTNYYFKESGNTSRDNTRKLSGNNSNMNITTVNAVCTLPFGKNNYSFGSKLTFINTANNNFLYNYVAAWQPDETQFNNFNYTENTQAFFAQAQKNIGKWGFLLGCRAENTQTKGYSDKIGLVNDRQYFKLFPTLNISYQPNDDNNVSFNYNRTIDRPTLQMINPFRRYDNENSYSQGNPFLQGYTMDNIEWTYLLFKKYTAVASYTHAANSYAEIQQVSNTSPIQVTGINNFIDYDEITFGLMADYVFFDKWKCSPQLFAIHNSIFSKDSSVNNSESNAIYIACNNQITLGEKKNLIIDTGFYYMSPRSAGTFNIKDTFNATAGVTYLAMNKNLQLNLKVFDIFKTGSFRYTSTVNGIDRDRSVYTDTRNIQLSLRYNFNKGTQKSVEHHHNNQDELNRTKS